MTEKEDKAVAMILSAVQSAKDAEDVSYATGLIEMARAADLIGHNTACQFLEMMEREDDKE